jgi:hypothetical protein
MSNNIGDLCGSNDGFTNKMRAFWCRFLLLLFDKRAVTAIREFIIYRFDASQYNHGMAGLSFDIATWYDRIDMQQTRSILVHDDKPKKTQSVFWAVLCIIRVFSRSRAYCFLKAFKKRGSCFRLVLRAMNFFDT